MNRELVTQLFVIVGIPYERARADAHVLCWFFGA